MTDNTYTTERGITVSFKGIAALLDKLHASHPMPAQPMYDLPVPATGLIEHHPLDEKTANTPEEKARLTEYYTELIEAQHKYHVAITRLVLMYGVEVAIPQDDTWVKRQEFSGIQVPTDPLARERHWRESELYGSPQDLENITLGVMRASGTDEEVLTAMADSFRHSVGKSAGKEVERPADPADEQSVVLQSAL